MCDDPRSSRAPGEGCEVDGVGLSAAILDILATPSIVVALRDILCSNCKDSILQLAKVSRRSRPHIAQPPIRSESRFRSQSTMTSVPPSLSIGDSSSSSSSEASIQSPSVNCPPAAPKSPQSILERRGMQGMFNLCLHNRGGSNMDPCNAQQTMQATPTQVPLQSRWSISVSADENDRKPSPTSTLRTSSLDSPSQQSLNESVRGDGTPRDPDTMHRTRSLCYDAPYRSSCLSTGLVTLRSDRSPRSRDATLILDKSSSRTVRDRDCLKGGYAPSVSSGTPEANAAQYGCEISSRWIAEDFATSTASTHLPLSHPLDATRLTEFLEEPAPSRSESLVINSPCGTLTLSVAPKIWIPPNHPTLQSYSTHASTRPRRASENSTRHPDLGWKNKRTSNFRRPLNPPPLPIRLSPCSDHAQVRRRESSEAVRSRKTSAPTARLIVRARPSRSFETAEAPVRIAPRRTFTSPMATLGAHGAIVAPVQLQNHTGHNVSDTNHRRPSTSPGIIQSPASPRRVLSRQRLQGDEQRSPPRPQTPKRRPSVVQVVEGEEEVQRQQSGSMDTVTSPPLTPRARLARLLWWPKS